MKKEVADFKELVHKLYKEHLDSLAKLPVSVPAPKPVQAVKEEIEPQPEPQEVSNVDDDNFDATIEIPDQNDIVVATQDVSIDDKNDQNTAEFVIEKKTVNENKEEGGFEENFRFKGLKFGADFDIKNDK